MAIRTIGALLVNPRRRRRKNGSGRRLKMNRRRGARRNGSKRRRRKAPRVYRRKNPRRARRVGGRIRVNRRRRKSRKGRRARRNPLVIRNRRRGRRRSRRNPLILRNRSRRRRSRRNPLLLRNPRLPIVGNLFGLGAYFSPAIFGAVAVEPHLLLAKFVAPMLPFEIPAAVWYPLAGVVAGALIKRLPIPFLSADTKSQLATAVAAAGGTLGYYKWRSGQDASMGSEVGMLDMSGYGAWGEGFASRVVGGTPSFMYAR